jgi:dihydroxyacetone kinase
MPDAACPGQIFTSPIGAVLRDLKLKPGSEALLLLNGFGGTPAMELYLMYNAARRILDGKGIKVARSLVGSYVTSLEMAGCSLTLSALDSDLTALWDSPILPRCAGESSRASGSAGGGIPRRRT